MGEKKKKGAKNKDGQLIIRISKEERKAFVDLCEEIDTTAAREIRLFIRRFITEHHLKSGKGDEAASAPPPDTDA